MSTIRAISTVRIILALIPLIIGCQIVQAPIVDTFPLHSEPLATDWGREYKMGELVLDGRCLRMQAITDLSHKEDFIPSFLPVWPEGFSWEKTESSVAIISPSGQKVAQVGDYVRLSGDGVRLESHREKQIADSLATDCEGPFYLVGDDVTVIVADEPEIVSVANSDIYFRRVKTEEKGFIPVAEPAYPYSRIPRTLTLEDGCILLVDSNGKRYVPVWPAGFTPHLENGVLEVRNGGGRTIGRVGARLRTRGYIAQESEGGLYVPECRPRLLVVWGVINTDLPLAFLEYDDRWVPGPEQVEDSLRGYVDVRNGCMHINNHFLLWPPDYRVKEEGDLFKVTDSNGKVVAQRGERDTLKGYRIRSDDKFGPEIVRTMPIDCPPRTYWIVTGHE